jgi:hypothetical protein
LESHSNEWEEFVSIPIATATFDGLNNPAHITEFATLFILPKYYYIQFSQSALVYFLQDGVFRPICFTSLSGVPIANGKILALIGLNFYLFNVNSRSVVISSEQDVSLGIFSDTYDSSFLGLDLPNLHGSCCFVEHVFRTNVKMTLPRDDYLAPYAVRVHKLHNIYLFLIKDESKFRVYMVEAVTTSFLGFLRTFLSNSLIYPE